MSEVETARLLLRQWQDEDLERLVALYGDPRVARFLSVDGRPWPRERSLGAFGHFRGEWQGRGFGPWAAIEKQTGRWVGRIGLDELADWPGPHKVEVGWELHREFWAGGWPLRAAGAGCATALRRWRWRPGMRSTGPTGRRGPA